MSTTNNKTPIQISEDFGEDLAYKAKFDAMKEKAKKVNAKIKVQGEKVLNKAKSENGAMLVTPSGKCFHLTSTVRVEYFVEKVTPEAAGVVEVDLSEASESEG